MHIICPHCQNALELVEVPPGETQEILWKTAVASGEQIRFVLARPDGRMEAEEVGGREGAAVQVGGQAHQEAVLRDLRTMGEQGLALDLAVWADIERHRRGLGARTTGLVPRSLPPGHLDTCRCKLGP